MCLSQHIPAVNMQSHIKRKIGARGAPVQLGLNAFLICVKGNDEKESAS